MVIAEMHICARSGSDRHLFLRKITRGPKHLNTGIGTHGGRSKHSYELTHDDGVFPKLVVRSLHRRDGARHAPAAIERGYGA